MNQNKYLGTIMGLEISVNDKGYYTDGRLFLKPGESIDDFCNQFKDLTIDPKERLIQAVEEYLLELDTEGFANSHRIRKALDRVKEAKP